MTIDDRRPTTSRRGRVRELGRVVTGLTLLLLAACVSGGQPPGLFTLDDEAIQRGWMTLDAHDSHPRAGDILPLNVPQRHGERLTFSSPLLLCLGREGPCSFITSQDTSTVRLKETGDTVGIQVHCEDSEGESHPFNPLTNLTPDALRRLWGLKLTYWTDEMGTALNYIDPANTLIQLHDDAARPDVLDRIPKSIRMLAVHPNREQPRFDFSSFTKLEFLQIGCSLLENLIPSPGLRYLEILYLGREFKDAQTLRNLSRLRILKIHFSPEYNDISFVAGLNNLQTLNLDDTAVTDLSPITGLSELQVVSARGIRATSLPEMTMPNLRFLDVTRTSLTHTEVTRFKSCNPRCKVRWGFTQILLEALSASNRLRVREGGMYWKEMRVLLETRKESDIKDLVSHIQVQDYIPIPFYCHCTGNPILEFYNNDRLLAEIRLFRFLRTCKWGHIIPPVRSVIREARRSSA